MEDKVTTPPNPPQHYSEIFTSFSSFFDWFFSSPLILTGVITAIFAFLTIKANRNANRVKNSIDFETTYKHTASISNYSREVLKIITKKHNCDLCHYMYSLGTEKNKLEEDTRNISSFLNEWERCANGCFHDIYDTNFFYGTYSGTVNTLFEKCLPFMLSRQETRSQNIKVYTKFLWLSTKWIIRSNSESGKSTDQNILNAYKALNKYHKKVKREAFIVKLGITNWKICKGKQKYLEDLYSTRNDLLFEAHTALKNYIAKQKCPDK